MNEGEELEYEVTLDVQPVSTLTVNITKSGTGNIDFASGQSATLEFTNGDWNMAQTVTLAATEDNTDATNETITLTHVVATGGATTDVALTVTAEDDEDPRISLVAPTGGGDTHEVNESAGSVVFTVEMRDSVTGSLVMRKENTTVEYQTTSSSCCAAVSGTLTIAIAQDTSYITVNISNDSVAFESDESFSLTLDNPSTGVKFADEEGSTPTSITANVTVVDDDSRNLTLSTSALFEGLEGGRVSTTLTARLDSPLTAARDLSIQVSFSGTATRGSDYTYASDSFTIPIASGASSGTFALAFDTTADGLYDGEEDETIIVQGTLDHAGGMITTNELTIATLMESDSAPTSLVLAVSPGNVGEADASTVITVTATIDRGFADATMVTISVDTSSGNGVASAGTDYTQVANFTATIARAATMGTITFNLDPTQDDVIEGPEIIALSGAIDSPSLTSDAVNITINDDDRAVLSFSSTDGSWDSSARALTITEPEPSGMPGSAIYTVTLDKAPGPGVTITIPPNAFRGGDDSSVENCSEAGTKLTISPFELTFTSVSLAHAVTATPCADELDGNDDTVVIEYRSDFVEPPTDPANDTRRITIFVEDVNTPEVIGLDARADEDAGHIVFAVQLSSSINSNVVISYETADDSNGGAKGQPLVPQPGENYDYRTETAGEVTIEANSKVSFLTIDIIDDNLVENDEYFNLKYTGVSVPDSQELEAICRDSDDDDEVCSIIVRGNILDDDVNEFTFTASVCTQAADGTISCEVNERGAPSVLLTVTPEAAASTLVRQVNLTFAGTATRYEDYQVDSSIDIPIGDSVSDSVITLTIDDDELYDEAETIEITATLAARGTASEERTVTINLLDDESLPTMNLTASPPTLDEGADSARFNVVAELSGGFDENKTVQVSVSADAAVAEQVADFSFTIPSGGVTGEELFTAVPVDDNIDKALSGTITVTGTLTAAATEPPLTAAATIPVVDDDDSPSVIELGATVDGTLITRIGENEGARQVTVIATVRGLSTFAAATEVMVSVAGSGAAGVVGFAVTPPTLPITIPVGARAATGTVTIIPVNNFIDEDDEAITISGSVAAAPGISVDAFIIDLIDDDSTPSDIALMISPSRVGESDGLTTITVTAGFPGVNPTALPTDVAIDVTVDRGTASPSDFEPVNSLRIIIEAGMMSGEATFEVQPVDDDITENDETLIVAGTGFGAVTPATLTIMDDDEAGFIFTGVPPGQNHPGLELHEEQDGAVVGVRLAARPTADVIVELSVSDRNPAAVLPLLLVFDASNWSEPQTFEVSALADGDQRDHDIAVVLIMRSSAAGYESLPDGSLPEVRIPLMITDDDGAGLVFDPAEVVVQEQGEVAYAVRLKTMPDADVTVTLMRPPGGHVNILEPSSCSIECTLVFAPDAWGTPQTVRIEGASDADGRDHEVDLSHAVQSQDEEYQDAFFDLKVAVDDDEELSLDFTPKELMVGEGEAQVYEVRLSSKPFSPVTIALSPGDIKKAMIAPATLTFITDDDADNGWQMPQRVTVAALDDEDAVDEDETITHAASSDDEDYHGKAFVLSLSINDDDTPMLMSVGIADGSGPVQGATYGVGEEIELAAEFSRRVRVRGNPRLRLTIGDTVRFAEALQDQTAKNGDNGSTTILFAYVVEPDDLDSDGLTIPANPLVLGEADSIIDAVELDDGREAPADFEVGDAFEQVVPEGGGMVNGGMDMLLLAVAGPDQQVEEDKLVTLDGSQSRAGEPDNIRYAWQQAQDGTQRADLGDATRPILVFRAPNFKTTTVLVFALKVSNSRTGDESLPGTVRVVVLANRDRPVAEAGPAQTVQEHEVVTLDGSASRDPEGDALTFAWAQIILENEPEVTLSDPTIAGPTFTAPVNVLDGTKLYFDLTVTDEDDQFDTDRVTITVTIIDFSGVLGHALSRFGRAVSSSAVDAVGERFGMSARRAGRTVNFGGTTVNLDEIGLGSGGTGSANAGGSDDEAGDSVMAPQPLFEGHFGERLQSGGRALEFNRNQLMQSSFEISVGEAVQSAQAEEEQGAEWMFWGRADSRSFEAEPEGDVPTAVSGDVSVIYVGTDIDLDRQGILGLALSNASGDLEFTEGEIEGTMSMNLLSIYPYGNWNLADWLTGWALFGTGSGEVELLTDIGHDITTDIAMTLIAGGMRGNLRRLGGFDLAVKGDVMLLNSSSDELRRRLDGVDVSVQWARFGFEVNRAWKIGKSVQLRPNMDLSGRFDGGDAETGFGVEVNLGTTFEHKMGLSLNVRVRQLLTHGESDSTESGASVALHYAPRRDGAGLMVSIAPTWGRMQSVASTIWRGGQPMLGEPPAADEGAAFHGWRDANVDAEFGYGILLEDWSVTPYGRVNVAEASGRSQWGVRISALQLGAGELGLDLFGERSQALSERGLAMVPTLKIALHFPLPFSLAPNPSAANP